MPSDRCGLCGTIIAELAEQSTTSHTQAERKATVHEQTTDAENSKVKAIEPASRVDRFNPSALVYLDNYSHATKLTQRRNALLKAKLTEPSGPTPPPSCCLECAEWAITAIDGQVTDARSWLNAARKCAEQLESAPDDSKNTERILRQNREIEKLLKDQSAVAKELVELREEYQKTNQELIEMAKEEDAIVEEELKLFNDQIAWVVSERNFQESRDSLMSEIQFATSQFEALAPVPNQRRVAFNDAFHIWHQGPYGTINGLRLGRLPSRGSADSQQGQVASDNKAAQIAEQSSDQHGISTVVSWDEVNNAWGQAAMLLGAIANSVHHTFSRYQVIAKGSRSVVVRLPSTRILQSESFSLFFDDVRHGHFLENLITGFRGGQSSVLATFNNAVTGFVICMKELMNLAMSDEVGKFLQLKGKMYMITVREPVDPSGQPVAFIERQPVTLNSVIDEPAALVWTKAMRSMLSNLKWLLVWCVKHTNNTPGVPK